MQFSKKPIALAAIGLLAGAPLAAHAVTVYFKAPSNGITLNNTTWNQSSACEVAGSNIYRVQFVLIDSSGRSTNLNNDTGTPFRCNLVSSSYANGKYIVRAFAYDKAGARAISSRTVNIANGTTTPPPSTGNTPPVLSITAPAAGSTLSGTAVAYSATATDTGGSVAKVEIYVKDASGQKLVATDTTSPYSGTFSTAGLASGPATLMAVATDNQGAQSTVQRSVTIATTTPPPNPTPTPDPTPNPTPGTSAGKTSLPSTNTKAVATFESLGMYWKPGTNPGADGCQVRYRKTSETSWKQGFPMWYDSRNAECRGSIVHLEPGAEYAVEMGVAGTFKAGVNVKTWSDNFPIAKTVQVSNSSQTLKITEGGTKDGYVLYTGPATIDVNNAAAYNIEISAPYVIVRGLTLKGAKNDAIRLRPGASDVVIEDNDISNWGSFSGNTLGGVQVGKERESAVRADCRDGGGFTLQRTVIQRNKMHHPRYGANSWDHGHPLGPQAIAYSFCGGNHVMRYNEIYSTAGRYFKDGIAGESNFSTTGFPNADSDIYGNIIQHAWDDGIEAEGGNTNVRIWGNYIDQTAIGIATTVVHHGPLYMFRNVYNRSRMKAEKSLDSDDRQNFAKSGTQSDFGGGRRYVFHNTLLQARQDGVTNGLGAGGGIIAAGSSSPLTNTMSRNNILQVWKASSDSIRTQGGGGNDFNYDLRNGGISAYTGAEANGMVGTPIYKSGHGWSNWAGGNYQLESNSPGYDKGQRLPNFNDGFTGSAPDVGAHESGTPAMKLGIGGATSQWAGPSGSTSTAGSTGSTSSSGEVCSTALCVVSQ